VDDEPANVHLITRLLESQGYTHGTSLTDPREILPYIVSGEPDLILLDLYMPHLDGFAVLELPHAWIAADSHVPIIVLTADATPAARMRALDAGATDFLTKPFDTAEVLLRVVTPNPQAQASRSSAAAATPAVIRRALIDCPTDSASARLPAAASPAG
jgi:putative two-component system response regulator